MSSLPVPKLLRAIYVHNPFYLISACLFVYGLQAVFRLVQLNAFVRKPMADLLCPRKQQPPDPQIGLTLRAA